MAKEPNPAVIGVAERSISAEILEFPIKTKRGGHARTSSGRAVAMPKTAGSTFLPIFANAAVTTKNFSAAIRPRDFQLLTADEPTPQSSATLVGPPSVSRTSSTVRSMGIECSRNVELSTCHITEIATTCELWLNSSMISEREFQIALAYRVRVLRAMQNESQIEFGKRISVGKSAISMYEKAERTIDPYKALILQQRLKAPMAWLYAGEEADLTDSFKRKLAEAMPIVDAEMANPVRPGRRKSQGQTKKRKSA